MNFIAIVCPKHLLTLSTNNPPLKVRAMSSIANRGAKQMIPFMKPSVWTEFVALTKQHNAINLGQGFPDYPPPEHIKQALIDSCNDTMLHQYTRGYGHPRLVKALSDMYGHVMNRAIDPMEEILVTVGAYESLYCAFRGFVDPGDEVILIEPFFDSYSSVVEMAGGKPIYIALKAPDNNKTEYSSSEWTLDMDELEKKITKKTKMLVFNNPNNPVGKVFTMDELNAIRELSIKHNLVVISDEVYEWIIHPPHKHIKLATLPGMWERTLTMGSAGKTFNVTGWKLGWTIGPKSLLSYLTAVHQNCIYTAPTILQEAVAVGLEKELKILGTKESYFTWVQEEMGRNRSEVVKMLKDFGFVPHVPEGGYFLMADFSKLDNLGFTFDESGDSKDFQFVRWMIKNKQLATIPPTAFYNKDHAHLGDKFIRVCFIKQPETIKRAAEVLKEWKKEL